MGLPKHYIYKHFGASKTVLTKARLLKHDLPVHGTKGGLRLRRSANGAHALEIAGAPASKHCNNGSLRISSRTPRARSRDHLWGSLAITPSGDHKSQVSQGIGSAAIPAAIYRSAQGPRAGKCPTECFLSAFLGTRLTLPLFCVLLGVFEPPKVQKRHSLRHSEPGAQRSTPKALRGTLSAPGPWALL